MAPDTSQSTSISAANSSAKSKPNKSPPVIKCPLCADNHVRCQAFADYDVDKRNKFVREKRLCTNCLGGHGYKNCPFKYTCRTCHNKHHTMLHREKSTRFLNSYGCWKYSITAAADRTILFTVRIHSSSLKSLDRKPPYASL